MEINVLAGRLRKILNKPKIPGKLPVAIGHMHVQYQQVSVRLKEPKSGWAGLFNLTIRALMSFVPEWRKALVIPPTHAVNGKP